MSTVRCAIYTRKSSDEGLEQDFNSLDAQREACAAYVLSQASEGWQLIPEFYDDGGISGGTLERPALQRLLADVAERRIDIIVVYKVDRLTRSLLDFAKLVETLDKAGTSFVSVTQSFNTTTSMGRLTLNMLLSFAQFEREVTAERIRDKITASKAKGMWMGGTPPIGYRPDGRSLAIIESEAETVRLIYRRYLELGTVRQVETWLKAEGITTPARVRGSGAAYGGRPFSRGHLYSILRSPIYAGDIPHKDKVYPGNHAAIIARETWDAVQTRLKSHVKGKRAGRAPTASLLAGRIIDAQHEPLLAVHASRTAKGGSESSKVRYRYYVSKALQHGTAKASHAGIRLPAREIEAAVQQEVARLFDDPIDLIERAQLTPSPCLMNQLTQRCIEVAAQLRQRGAGPLMQILQQVRVLGDRIEIRLDTAALSEIVMMPRLEAAEDAITLPVEYRLTRTGRALRLVQGDRVLAGSDAQDQALIKLLLKARRWWSILAKGDTNIDALSEAEGVTASYVTRVVRLAFLAPEVVEAVLDGKLKAGVSGSSLVNMGSVPALWDEQREQLISGLPR